MGERVNLLGEVWLSFDGLSVARNKRGRCFSKLFCIECAIGVLGKGLWLGFQVETFASVLWV